MVLTIKMDFRNNRYYENSELEEKELSKKTIELLESITPGNFLILKKHINLANKIKEYNLYVASKIDDIFMEIDETIDEVLDSLTELELIEWASKLAKLDPSGNMDKVVPILHTYDKNDIFEYILDNNQAGNLQIKEVKYSVEQTILEIMIMCETCGFGNKKLSKSKLEVINTTLVTPEYEEEIERAIQYLPIYYDKQKEFIKQLLKQGKTAWIPTEKEEVHAISAFLYLNALQLRQIVLVEPSKIYKLQYMNGIIDKLDQEPNYNGERLIDEKWHSSNDYHIPKYKYGNGALLGCFSHLDVEHAKKMAESYKDFNISGGGYIFLCPIMIKEFAEEIYVREYIEWQEEVSDSIKNLELLGVKTFEDLIYKLIFLHEVGHLCCHNTSNVMKSKDNESLANWIASMNITLFERKMIEHKTKYQPREYQDFITLPYYGYEKMTPGIVKKASDYKKIINLLNFTMRK